MLLIAAFLSTEAACFPDGRGTMRSAGFISIVAIISRSVLHQILNVVTSYSAAATTGMLDSQTFDTGVTSGAQLNSIMWKGGVPSGTSVGFQIAVSNSSSGPWSFIGPDGTSATTYTGVAGTPISLSNYSSLAGRYFRYRAILTTNTGQTVSPTVTRRCGKLEPIGT